MRIAVLGANGQLGTDAVRAFTDDGNTVHGLTHHDIEVANFDSVRSALLTLGPQLIVNTSAMHHVESCEREPAKAFEINALGARNLAIAARELGATLMHVSTDYVFDGAKGSPYFEDDAPRPLNAYGITKLSGEHFVQCTTEKHFIMRTSALYGKSSCRGKGGLNFVELMLKLIRERREVRVVNDEIVSPTFTEELARQMVVLSHTEAYGLYHATAEGACSWYDFAREVLTLTNAGVQLNVASSEEFPAKVPRPKYSVLENYALNRRKLNVFGHWQEGVRKYLGLACPAATSAAL